MSPVHNIPGNTFDKYRSGNPVHRMLMRGFLQSARGLLQSIAPLGGILEVGCGPGDLAYQLFGKEGHAGYIGTDISEGEIAIARKRYPQFTFQAASVYALPFPDGSFDCVIACEILEHLEDPERALREIARVARRSVLVSVPREPLWRILNVLRGAYITDFGNTPGHLQHFSRRKLRALVGRHFAIVAERCPLPWMMVVGEMR